MKKDLVMDFRTCPCSGANLPRFLQPILLAILFNGPLHGYKILQKVSALDFFTGSPPDATGVYRLLKSMESSGSLTAEWELGENGPAKKRYALTKRGRLCLAQWKKTLAEHRQFMDSLYGFVSEVCDAPPPPKKSRLGKQHVDLRPYMTKAGT